MLAVKKVLMLLISQHHFFGRMKIEQRERKLLAGKRETLKGFSLGRLFNRRGNIFERIFFSGIVRAFLIIIFLSFHSFFVIIKKYFRKSQLV
jgi:hypothetical protein